MFGSSFTCKINIINCARVQVSNLIQGVGCPLRPYNNKNRRICNKDSSNRNAPWALHSYIYEITAFNVLKFHCSFIHLCFSAVNSLKGMNGSSVLKLNKKECIITLIIFFLPFMLNQKRNITYRFTRMVISCINMSRIDVSIFLSTGVVSF